jgi:hypothetical protein
MIVLYFAGSKGNLLQIRIDRIMRKTASLFVASIISIGAMAQSITPDVISSAGDHYDNGSYQLSWTLGEVAVQTYDNGSNMLTEGFHQPEILITSIEEENLTDIDLNIYPNPTTQFINIELRNNESNMTAVVLDMSGKTIFTKSIEAFQVESGFDLSNLAAGGYLLQITEKDGKFRSTHQIQKTK